MEALVSPVLFTQNDVYFLSCQVNLCSISLDYPQNLDVVVVRVTTSPQEPTHIACAAHDGMSTVCGSGEVLRWCSWMVSMAELHSH
jgi:hypothetical protein